MGRQLGTVFADDTVINHLRDVADGRAVARRDGDCTVAFLGRQRVGTQVVLVLYQGSVQFIAGVYEETRADDLRWLFRLRRLTRLGHPVEASRLREVLRRDQQRPFDNQGRLTPKASEAVLNVVLEDNPDLGPVIGTLYGIRDLDLPAPRKQALAEERDALASLFAFTGAPDLAPAGGFLSEDEIGDIYGRESFLPPMGGVAPREDPMIEHDANWFLGWTRQPTDRLAVRKFEDNHGRTLEVMNVNRWPIETRLGTDLIYYHRQRHSFVLVQYKRLVPDGSHWRCRVDQHFQNQLEAMRKLDVSCAPKKPGGDYRMLPTPSFVKVCRLDTLDVDSTSMITGMYMPREQVERYLERPESPKYLDPETFKDHLTSTMFAQLVAVGAVGTVGAGTELIKAEIESSLSQKKSVSVGLFSDTTGRRPSWRSTGTKPAIPNPRTRRVVNSQQGSLW
jgi:hypothetical protein